MFPRSCPRVDWEYEVAMVSLNGEVASVVRSGTKPGKRGPGRWRLRNCLSYPDPVIWLRDEPGPGAASDLDLGLSWELSGQSWTGISVSQGGSGARISVTTVTVTLSRCHNASGNFSFCHRDSPRTLVAQICRASEPTCRGGIWRSN